MANNIDEDAQKLYDEIGYFAHAVNKTLDNAEKIDADDVFKIRMSVDDIVRMADDHWDDCIDLKEEIIRKGNIIKDQQKARIAKIGKLWQTVDDARKCQVDKLPSILEQIQTLTEELMSMEDEDE